MLAPSVPITAADVRLFQTTGSVAPNSSDGGPVATATSPANASGSAGAGGNGSATIKLSTAVAWSIVAVLTATGALLL
jgi:hypothetical protein